MNQLRPRLLQALKWLRKRLLLILGLSLLVLLFIGLIAFLYAVPWSGLGERPNLSEDFEPAKTLWDWLELLIVPAILALGALWFNNETRKRERAQEERRVIEQRALEEDRFREEALQTYLDKIIELLLNRQLNTPEPPEEVKSVASLRTITVLRRLDQDRRNEVIDFLRDSGLITREESILVGVTMIGIDLSGAILWQVNLRGAILYGANLRNSHLGGTDLSGADLSTADLSYATLFMTNMRGADLRNTKVTPQQLAGAKLDQRTIMPDGKPLNESNFMKQGGSEAP